MNLLGLLLLVAIAVALLWPRPVFVIVIAGDGVRLARGKVPRGFLEECQTLVSECGLRQGRVSGQRSHGRVELRFSGGFPEADRQRFRNVWSLYA
jgi:hypothetical protein